MTEQRFVFGEVAPLYDRYRPGYSDELVARVLAYAELPPHGRILEVGCGTGQATRSFASHGHRMLCLEPSPAMAALAHANLESLPRVEIVVETFEDWPLPEQPLHLIISAQAFHWVDPELRFVKAARALERRGVLAVFGHTPLPGAGAVREQIDAAYEECAPGMIASLPGGGRVSGPSMQECFAEAKGFDELISEAFPWWHEFSTEDYLGLMQTQSNHRLLPANQLDALLARLERILDDNGGSVRVQYVTRLLMARKIG